MNSFTQGQQIYTSDRLRLVICKVSSRSDQLSLWKVGKACLATGKAKALPV